MNDKVDIVMTTFRDAGELSAGEVKVLMAKARVGRSMVISKDSLARVKETGAIVRIAEFDVNFDEGIGYQVEDLTTGDVYFVELLDVERVSPLEALGDQARGNDGISR